MEEYYYIDAAGLQQGPVPADRLIALGVGRKTPVWKAGMANWTIAENVPELASLFAEQPPVFAEPARSASEPTPAKPQTYLVWAILTTICCCLPLGVVSIVYACRVDGLWVSGQYEQATACSLKARNWAIASVVASILLACIYPVIMLLTYPELMDSFYINY